jgi:ATP-dependent Clp protease ATP-binding subunit ClpA
VAANLAATGEEPEEIVSEREDPGPVPTPRYHRVLAVAAELAAELQHSYVGVEHLFLAMLRDPYAVPTQALASVCDLDQAEARLLAVMASDSYSRRGQAPGPPASL